MRLTNKIDLSKWKLFSGLASVLSIHPEEGLEFSLELCPAKFEKTSSRFGRWIGRIIDNLSCGKAAHGRLPARGLFNLDYDDQRTIPFKQ